MTASKLPTTVTAVFNSVSKPASSATFPNLSRFLYQKLRANHEGTIWPSKLAGQSALVTFHFWNVILEVGFNVILWCFQHQGVQSCQFFLHFTTSEFEQKEKGEIEKGNGEVRPQRAAAILSAKLLPASLSPKGPFPSADAFGFALALFFGPGPRLYIWTKNTWKFFVVFTLNIYAKSAVKARAATAVDPAAKSCKGLLRKKPATSGTCDSVATGALWPNTGNTELGLTAAPISAEKVVPSTWLSSRILVVQNLIEFMSFGASGSGSPPRLTIAAIFSLARYRNTQVNPKKRMYVCICMYVGCNPKCYLGTL